jgi:hypothetical protein
MRLPRIERSYRDDLFAFAASRGRRSTPTPLAVRVQLVLREKYGGGRTATLIREIAERLPKGADLLDAENTRRSQAAQAFETERLRQSLSFHSLRDATAASQRTLAATSATFGSMRFTRACSSLESLRTSSVSRLSFARTAFCLEEMRCIHQKETGQQSALKRVRTSFH